MILAAASLLVVGVMAASPASAQYIGGTPPTVGPVVKPVVVAPAAPSPAKVQLRETTQAPRTRRFAVTGADIAQMVMIGAASVVGGAALIRQGRRRAAAAS